MISGFETSHFTYTGDDVGGQIVPQDEYQMLVKAVDKAFEKPFEVTVIE